MHKTGVSLPGILKWIMTLIMKKFVRLAAKNGVNIIEPVTGANGKLMQDAVDLIAPVYVPGNYKVLTIADIESKGLSGADIGKVITFNR